MTDHISVNIQCLDCGPPYREYEYEIRQEVAAPNKNSDGDPIVTEYLEPSFWGWLQQHLRHRIIVWSDD